MDTIDGTAGLRQRIGTELGVSSWFEITQERIDAFAAATDDYEDIHVDPERAARTRFGVTIAHGLLTVSLGPKFQYELLEITGVSLALNYGFDRVRFVAPVLVGSRVRMRMRLTEVDDVPGGIRAHVEQTFEIEGQTKPACVAESVAVYYD